MARHKAQAFLLGWLDTLFSGRASVFYGGNEPVPSGDCVVIGAVARAARTGTPIIDTTDEEVVGEWKVVQKRTSLWSYQLDVSFFGPSSSEFAEEASDSLWSAAFDLYCDEEECWVQGHEEAKRLSAQRSGGIEWWSVVEFTVVSATELTEAVDAIETVEV